MVLALRNTASGGAASWLAGRCTISASVIDRPAVGRLTLLRGQVLLRLGLPLLQESNCLGALLAARGAAEAELVDVKLHDVKGAGVRGAAQWRRAQPAVAHSSALQEQLLDDGRVTAAACDVQGRSRSFSSLRLASLLSRGPPLARPGGADWLSLVDVGVAHRKQATGKKKKTGRRMARCKNSVVAIAIITARTCTDGHTHTRIKAANQAKRTTPGKPDSQQTNFLMTSLTSRVVRNKAKNPNIAILHSSSCCCLSNIAIAQYCNIAGAAAAATIGSCCCCCCC
jgi:hypothetical protein